MQRLEASLQQSRHEQDNLLARLEKGDERTLQLQRDAEQLREQKVEAQRGLAVLEAHKSGVETLARRAMSQLKTAEEEKQALLNRIDASESHCVQARPSLGQLPIRLAWGGRRCTGIPRIVRNGWGQ